MATLTFSLGPICAGGNHYDVTFHRGAQSVTLPIQYPDLAEPLTREEEEAFFILLLRLLINDLPVPKRSVADVRQKLATASLALKI